MSDLDAKILWPQAGSKDGDENLASSFVKNDTLSLLSCHFVPVPLLQSRSAAHRKKTTVSRYQSHASVVEKGVDISPRYPTSYRCCSDSQEGIFDFQLGHL